MTDMKDIVKLAVDAYKGKVENYSQNESQEVLRQALIDANGGSTVLNYRNIRDGKCNGVFALIEEILDNTIVEGLSRDMYFNTLVDFRNVAEGDSPIFYTNENTLFVVNEAADGTQGIRRQRLGAVGEVQIPTTLKAVRIYEELNRVLAGRVDFNEMIARVGKSFEQKLLTDIYTLWTHVTANQIGGSTFYPAAGAYSADTLLTLIEHVEAASGGQQATIVGTKKALRKLVEAVQSDEAKEELHNLGYYGKFYGTPMVATPQRHAVGGTDFILSDDVVTVIATGDKPIKVVYEGDPLVIMGDPKLNADLTQEYFYASKWGTGLILPNNSGLGIYDMRTT